jgi:hypothetical protein
LSAAGGLHPVDFLRCVGEAVIAAEVDKPRLIEELHAAHAR